MQAGHALVTVPITLFLHGAHDSLQNPLRAFCQSDQVRGAESADYMVTRPRS